MQLHFKEFGRGEPLIILHGLFGSSDNWLGLARKFAEKFHVFVLDLRNHGRSPHSDALDYSIMAEDVLAFLDAHQLESANLLGHSMGGKVAMQLALNFPARVNRLVVADMPPRACPPQHEEIFSALLALDLAKFKTRQQIEDALAPGIPELAVRRFLLKNLGSHAAGSYFWKINLCGLFENYSGICEAISASSPFQKPALFLRGGKSNYISDADAPLIRQLFPQARIETIFGAGHWLHADAPEEFVRHTMNFL